MNRINGIEQGKYVSERNLYQCIGKKIYMKGSIYKIRKMKGFAFVLIRTSKRIVQSVYSEEKAKFSIDILTCCEQEIPHFYKWWDELRITRRSLDFYML